LQCGQRAIKAEKLFLEYVIQMEYAIQRTVSTGADGSAGAYGDGSTDLTCFMYSPTNASNWARE
jgi:hypothetical protein